MTPEQKEARRAYKYAWACKNKERLARRLQWKRDNDPSFREGQRRRGLRYYRKHRDRLLAKASVRHRHLTDEQKKVLAERSLNQYYADLENSRIRSRDRARRRRVQEIEGKRVWEAAHPGVILAREEERKARALNQELRRGLAARVRIALRKNWKVSSTVGLLGCSLESARKHLESQFKPGMTWDSWGVHGWHIDHKRPCASFDLSDPEQQKQCFHYSNLQPLWAKENISKGDKIL